MYLRRACRQHTVGSCFLGAFWPSLSFNWCSKPLMFKVIVDICCSVTQSCPILYTWTPRTPAHQTSLSFTMSLNLPRLMCFESVMPSNHLVLCHPFSSCLQSFLASGSFLMSWLCTSGGQSIGASASASVLSVNIQDWFPLGLNSLISLQSEGLSRVFSNTTVKKYQFLGTQPSLWSNSHMTTGKTIALTIQAFVGKVMTLLFNMLSRFVIAFLPRNNCLSVSWLKSPSALILELKKIKSVTISIISPSVCHEVMGPDAMILVFWMLSLSQLFPSLLLLFLVALFSLLMLMCYSFAHIFILILFCYLELNLWKAHLSYFNKVFPVISWLDETHPL